jgi:hypothetical protein
MLVLILVSDLDLVFGFWFLVLASYRQIFQKNFFFLSFSGNVPKKQF